MHLKNKPPIFIPAAYCAEIEKLSKAALMDLVWDLCGQLCGEAENADLTIKQFRASAEIVLSHRKQAA